MDKMSTSMEALVAVPPGISWTMPDKSMAWQNPPKITNLAEIANGYISMLSHPEMADDMLDALETGVPIAVVAETMMLSGVQSGVHSVDMGTLVMPVIIEMLKTTAELYNISYITFPDEAEKKNKVSNRMAREAVGQVLSVKSETISSPEEKLAAEPPSSTGLMARKPQENM